MRWKKQRGERADLAQQEQNKYNDNNKGNKYKKQNLGIYIHIPFCVQKCYYCDFLSAAAPQEEIENYINALTEEIEKTAPFYGSYEADTIFLGGGTPSILTTTQLGRIMKALQRNFFVSKDAEITIESNPGTLDIEKLHCYREYRVNRLSIGLQSTEDRELQLLGRIHKVDDFLNNFQAARQAGFQNINIDIMSALPDQTVISYKNTLQTVACLQPEHISAYSLIVEEGTPLEQMVTEWKENNFHTLPEEDQERQMYYDTKEILHSYGYERYEISNYAKPHCQCRHNLKYWKRENYLGLGLGAASMVENVRWKNIENLKEYMSFWQSAAPSITQSTVPPTANKQELHIDRWKVGIREIQKLSVEEQMEEFMFLGLRCTKGIEIKAFRDCFHRDIQDVYGKVLDKWIAQNILIRQEGRIYFSDKGFDVSNYILSDFILD